MRLYAHTAKGATILPPDTVTREVLLSFWKVHILHHAAERAVWGQWIADELRWHGYNISPGTLYPLLNRMEKHGWLKSRQKPNVGANSRKEYRLTNEGEKVLALIREQVKELHREVVEGKPDRHGRRIVMSRRP